MEVLEERVSGQIARVQQQSERSRDSALARLDSKIGTMELLQPKVDRRLAELNGNLKALSEESQTQIRRMDQIDSRLWDWRHKLDEEIRGKLAQIDQANQELASSVRVTKATNEDVLKRYHQRLLRLEQLVDERGAQHEDFSSSLMSMHARLLELEHAASPGLRGSPDLLARDTVSEVAASAGVATLETQVHELAQKVKTLQEEGYDLRGRVESQQEHHKAMRAQLEAKDDQIRSLDNRMNRENWEGRLKDLQRSVDESVQGSLGHSEHVQILQRRLESHEETQAELSGHIRRLQERQVVLGIENAGSSTPRSVSPPSGLPGAFDETAVGERLDGCEGAVADLRSKVDAISVSMDVAPRVSALVDTLQDVSPKIIEHEESLKDLSAKIDAVEVELRDVHEGLSARVLPMQAEVRDCLACQAEIRDEMHGNSVRCAKLEADLRVQAASAREAELEREAHRDLSSRVARLEEEACPQAELRDLADGLATRVERLEAEVHGAPGYEEAAPATATATASALPAPELVRADSAPHLHGLRPTVVPEGGARAVAAALPQAASPMRRASSTE